MQTLDSSLSPHPTREPPPASVAMLSPRASVAMLSPRASVAPQFDLHSLDGHGAVLGAAFLLEVGEEFRGELRVGGAPLAFVEGRVVGHHRGAEPGMQVAFEHITPAARDALAQIGAARIR